MSTLDTSDDRIRVPSATGGAPAPAGLDRRRALCGLAALGIGVPALSACGATVGGGEDAPAVEAGSGEPLVAAADVPVGGAVITDSGVVVAQPSQGEFVGYDPTCSHQGCAVSRVDGDEVVCTCHNSRFSTADGAVVGGPAPDGLREVPVRVEGDQVVGA